MKNFKKASLVILSSLFLFSCDSKKETTPSEEKTSVSTLTKDERKNQIVQAFYDYTLSKDGFETARSHGGIIKDSEYLAAEDFKKNDYSIFSLDNSDITIKVGGSTSVTDVSDAQIVAFTAFFKGNKPTFTKDRKGSGTAVSGLESGLYDIGYLSRELESTESDKLKSLNGKSAHFCIDAVVPICNNSNKLESITRDQLALIYGDKAYL